MSTAMTLHVSHLPPVTMSERPRVLAGHDTYDTTSSVPPLTDDTFRHVDGLNAPALGRETARGAHPSSTRRGAVRAVLEARGDDPALAGTRAATRWCRTCRRVVLAGYDAPVLAGLAVVDPFRATWRDEAAAVVLGRASWWLAGPWPIRGELIPRHTPGQHPLGTKPPADDVLVVLAHACGTPPLATAPLPARTTATARPTNPPF